MEDPAIATTTVSTFWKLLSAQAVELGYPRDLVRAVEELAEDVAGASRAFLGVLSLPAEIGQAHAQTLSRLMEPILREWGGSEDDRQRVVAALAELRQAMSRSVVEAAFEAVTGLEAFRTLESKYLKLQVRLLELAQFVDSDEEWDKVIRELSWLGPLRTALAASPPSHSRILLPSAGLSARERDIRDILTGGTER